MKGEANRMDRRTKRVAQGQTESDTEGGTNGTNDGYNCAQFRSSAEFPFTELDLLPVDFVLLKHRV